MENKENSIQETSVTSQLPVAQNSLADMLADIAGPIGHIHLVDPESKVDSQDELIVKALSTAKRTVEPVIAPGFHEIEEPGFVDVIERHEVETKTRHPPSAEEMEKMMSTYKERLSLDVLADVTYSMQGYTGSRISAYLAATVRDRTGLTRVARSVYNSVRVQLEKEAGFDIKARQYVPNDPNEIVAVAIRATTEYTSTDVLDYCVPQGSMMFSTREADLLLCDPTKLMPKVTKNPIPTPKINYGPNNTVTGWSFKELVPNYQYFPIWITTNVTREFIAAIAHTERNIEANRMTHRVDPKTLDAMHAQVQNLVRLAASVRLSTGAPINSFYRLLIGSAVHVLPRGRIPDQALLTDVNFVDSFLSAYQMNLKTVQLECHGKKVSLYHDVEISEHVIATLKTLDVSFSDILDVVFRRYDVDNMLFTSYGVGEKGGSAISSLRQTLERLRQTEDYVDQHPDLEEGLTHVLNQEMKSAASRGGVRATVNNQAQFGPLLPEYRNGDVVGLTHTGEPIHAIARLVSVFCDIFDLVYVPMRNAQKKIADLESKTRTVPANLREEFATLQGKVLTIFDILVKLKNAKPKPEVVAVDSHDRVMKRSKPARFIYSGTNCLPLTWILAGFPQIKSPHLLSTMGYNHLTEGGLTLLFEAFTDRVNDARAAVAFCMSDNLYVLVPNGKKVRPLRKLYGKPELVNDFQFYSFDGRNMEATMHQSNRSAVIRWFISKIRACGAKRAEENKIPTEYLVNEDFLRFVEDLMSNTMPFHGTIGAQFEMEHTMASGDRDTSIANDAWMGALAVLINESGMRPPLAKWDNDEFFWNDSLDDVSDFKTPMLHMPSIFAEMAETFGLILKPSAVVGTAERGFIDLMHTSLTYVPIDYLGFGVLPLHHLNGVDTYLAPMLDPVRLAGALAYSKPLLRKVHEDSIMKQLLAFANLAKCYSLLICGAWAYPGFLQTLLAMQQLALAALTKTDFTQPIKDEVLDFTFSALQEAGIFMDTSGQTKLTLIKQLAAMLPPDLTTIIDMVIPQRLYMNNHDQPEAQPYYQPGTVASVADYFSTYIPTYELLEPQEREAALLKNNNLTTIGTHEETDFGLDLKSVDLPDPRDSYYIIRARHEREQLIQRRRMARPKSIRIAKLWASVLDGKTLRFDWPITRILQTNKQAMIVAWKMYYYTHVKEHDPPSIVEDYKKVDEPTLHEWFEGRLQLAREGKTTIKFAFTDSSIRNMITLYRGIDTDRGKLMNVKVARYLYSGYVLQPVRAKLQHSTRREQKTVQAVDDDEQEMQDMEDEGPSPEYMRLMRAEPYNMGNFIVAHDNEQTGRLTIPKPVNLPSEPDPYVKMTALVLRESNPDEFEANVMGIEESSEQQPKTEMDKVQQAEEDFW